MRGRKVNAEIEQRTRALPDGLKRGWEGSRLPPVPYHQARALDPVDPGGGGWQASTHTKSPGSCTTRSTLLAYADRTSCSSGSRSANPVNLLRRRQEGLDCQSVQLSREGAALLYSSPEADWFGQGPAEPDQTLCEDVQHLKKTHKVGSEAKRSQSAQEIPVIHPVERLLLIQGQEGERQTVPTPEFQEALDQIEVVEDGAARDGVGDHVRQHGPQPQRESFRYDLVVCAEERDGTPISYIAAVPVRQ
ncbi:unnamed protein product [Caretta caretta]